MKENKVYKVDAIKDGTVIDHIPAQRAMKVVRALGLLDGELSNFMTVGINMKSQKHGHKDIIKIENRELSEDEANKIALIAPTATFNIIREYKVHKKYKAELPDMIKGIVKCSNPKCVTNIEHDVATRFYAVGRSPLKVRCHYCERCMAAEDIEIL